MNFLKKLWSLILTIIVKVIFHLTLGSNINRPIHDKGGFSLKSRSSNDCQSGKQKELAKELRRELLPRHVAVICDGNRRWAKLRGATFVEGYNAGAEALRKFVELVGDWGIPVASLFLFSSENWLRPQAETAFLMQLAEDILVKELSFFMRRGAKISVIGDKSLFPLSLQEAINKAEEATMNNTEIHLLLAMSYSGQNDIIQACQNIATRVKEGNLEPRAISSSLFEKELKTNVADVPCPDLLIRTSGELRISNFFLWQFAYTELYFTDAMWPDFGEDEFVKALHSFQLRGRRFGKD